MKFWNFLRRGARFLHLDGNKKFNFKFKKKLTIYILEEFLDSLNFSWNNIVTPNSF